MGELYLPFKTFTDSETAQDFAEVLKFNNIPFFIEEDVVVFDPSYANNPLNKDYAIKIRQQDFINATKAYEEYFLNYLEQVDPEYYLFGFENEELKEILAKPDEWGSFDYQLAQKILKERGAEVSPEEKETLKAKRYKELSKPEEERTSQIILTYILCFFLLPVGLIIAWIWGYSKKTLPDGRRVYTYSKAIQKHGRRIFIIGTILSVVAIILKMIGFV